MKIRTLALALGLLAGSSGLTLASDYCTMAPSNEWRGREDARTAAIALGYEVTDLKVEDNCFVLYSSKDGKKLEVYMDPVNLTVVRQRQLN